MSKQIYEELIDIFTRQQQISFNRMNKSIEKEDFFDTIYFKIRYNTISEMLDLIKVCEISNIDKE